MVCVGGFHSSRVWGQQRPPPAYRLAVQHVDTTKTFGGFKKKCLLVRISELKRSLVSVVSIHGGHLSENKLRRFRINGSVLLSIWGDSAEGEEAAAEILYNIQEVSKGSKVCRRLISCSW